MQKVQKLALKNRISLFRIRGPIFSIQPAGGSRNSRRDFLEIAFVHAALRMYRASHAEMSWHRSRAIPRLLHEHFAHANVFEVNEMRPKPD